MTRTTILVTCCDTNTARDFALPGARVKRNHGTRVVVSVSSSKLDATLDILDESDDVTGFEYDLEEEE